MDEKIFGTHSRKASQLQSARARRRIIVVPSGRVSKLDPDNCQYVNVRKVSKLSAVHFQGGKSIYVEFSQSGRERYITFVDISVIGYINSKHRLAMSKPGQAIIIVGSASSCIPLVTGFFFAPFFKVGGASGIGESTVRLAAKRQLKVIIADTSEPRGKALEQELLAAGHTCAFVPVDITNSNSIDNLITKSVALYARIDYAVNTAGYTGQTIEGHLLEDAEYLRIMTVDVEGTWRFTKAFIKYFRSLEPRHVRHDIGPYWGPVTQRGSIVLVASSLGSEGKEHLAAYCGAKHAVIGMMKSFALENASWGIRINTVSPGKRKESLSVEFESAKC